MEQAHPAAVAPELAAVWDAAVAGAWAAGGEAPVASVSARSAAEHFRTNAVCRVCNRSVPIATWRWDEKGNRRIVTEQEVTVNE